MTMALLVLLARLVEANALSAKPWSNRGHLEETKQTPIFFLIYSPHPPRPRRAFGWH